MAAVLFTLGIAFTLYGLLVLAAGSGTKFFLVWIAMGAASVLSALCISTGFAKRLPAGLRKTALTLVLAAVIVVAGVSAVILRGFRSRGEENLDCIIVLGAQVHSSGPSVVLRYRLDAAKEYLENNPGTKCIVTGGKGDNEPFPEAFGMRDYLVRGGIPEERIIMESKSANTVQNIRNSLAFLDPEKDRVGIVTNNFHLYRGTAIAKKAGIAHVSGIAAGSTKIYLPNNMLREVLGVIKDILAGNM